MKERGIIFTTDNVRLIEANKKGQTRRVVKNLAPHDVPTGIVDGYKLAIKSHIFGDFYDDLLYSCPYGQPGDRLYIKETWRPCEIPHCSDSLCVEYRANERCKNGHLATLNRKGWKSSMFMPKALARIWLEIADIRLERLQDISESDARAEGVKDVAEYKAEWDTINGKKNPWSSNPWVWVIEFRKP